MTGSDGCVTVVGMPPFPSTILHVIVYKALEKRDLPYREVAWTPSIQ